MSLTVIAQTDPAKAVLSPICLPLAEQNRADGFLEHMRLLVLKDPLVPIYRKRIVIQEIRTAIYDLSLQRAFALYKSPPIINYSRYCRHKISPPREEDSILEPATLIAVTVALLWTIIKKMR